MASPTNEAAPVTIATLPSRFPWLGRRHAAPLATLPQTVEAIDAAKWNNVGLVLDFWHLWNRGHIGGAHRPTRSTNDLRRRLQRLAGASADRDPRSGEWPRLARRGRDLAPGVDCRDSLDRFDGWWGNEPYSPRSTGSSTSSRSLAGSCRSCARRSAPSPISASYSKPRLGLACSCKRLREMV